MIDVSFISPAGAAGGGGVSAPAQLLALIATIRGRPRPQKGVVRDHGSRGGLRRHRGFVASLGWRVIGIIPSPIAGGDGNAEFLLGAAHD